MRISDWSSDVCSSDLFGAQLALVSGLTQDARARKAAPVAKAREGDFNELQAIEIRDQPPRILARLEPHRGRVGLFEKGVERDRRLFVRLVVAVTETTHKWPPRRGRGRRGDRCRGSVRRAQIGREPCRERGGKYG